MRRHPDEDIDFNQTEFDRYKAAPWMVAALRCNPEYCWWGPGDEYMTLRGDGWNVSRLVGSWKEFDSQLNNLNEVVNFYFEVRRDSEDCKACFGSGYNAETYELSQTFYDSDNFSANNKRWCDDITQDELIALQEQGRLRGKDSVTIEQVNAANHEWGFNDLKHDAINRHILIETRAKRLGVYGKCSKCGGHGHIFTEPEAHLALVLWILHPRKGASRGVDIARVERTDLPAIREFLQLAAKRNADRFGKLSEMLAAELAELVLNEINQSIDELTTKHRTKARLAGLNTIHVRIPFAELAELMTERIGGLRAGVELADIAAPSDIELRERWLPIIAARIGGVLDQDGAIELDIEVPAPRCMHAR